MIVTKFRPDFQFNTAKDNHYIAFNSPSTGNIIVFDALGTHKKASETRTGKRGSIIAPALGFEQGFCRMTGPTPNPPSGEIYDTTKVSHTTGGGRRSYISSVFEKIVRGEGILDDLESWNNTQFLRPVAHLPFTFSYTAYYGICADGWKYDLVDGEGYDIFDPAHLESSSLFSGAAFGIDESLANFTMLLAWVASSFPGILPNGAVAKGWTGSQQPRAVGWMLQFFTRACLLGFDTADQEFKDRFLAGHGPKEHLIAYVKDLLANPIPLGADHVSESTMVDLKDGSGELKGGLGFQEAILLNGIGYLLRSNVISDRLLAGNLLQWAQDRSAAFLARATDSTGLMSFSFSTNGGFTQATVDRANALEKDPGHVYRLAPLATGYIQDTPRLADVELLMGALAMLDGTDAFTDSMASLLPKPGDPAWNDKARYGDVYYALKERGL